MSGTAIGLGGLAGASALLIASAPMTMAQNAATHQLNIPAQSLSRALRDLAQQSGIQIAYRTSIAAGAQAPAVQGALTAEQALARLLAGSGLRYSFSGATTVTILGAADDASAGGEAGAGNLGTIVLNADATLTEGTGSYTTGAATGSTGLPISLKETPQSVTVITNQRLKDQGLATTQQMLAYTTGVQSAIFETDRDNTWSRGQWVSSYIIDGVVIDGGIGFMSGVGLQSSTSTYDHAEVIRGATGLLTGPGDPSAAVRMERKKATATELTGTIEARYGSWNRMGLGIDVSNKLNASGTLRGRLVADVYSGDSFRDRYSVDKQTIYGTIAWDIDAATTLSFSYERRNHDPKGSEWSAFPTLFSDGTPTNLPRHLSSAPYWASWGSEQDMATVRVDHDFGGGWTGNATLSAVKRNYTAENTRFYGRPDPITGLGMTLFARKADEFQRQIALDASVSGPVTLFGREHALNFGMHAGRDWNRADDYDVVGAQPVMGSIYDWDGSLPRPQFYLPQAGEWTEKSTEYSGYASTRLSLADPLNAILGLRYTDWGADTRHFTEVTPYFGLVYDVNENVSVFASYTQIFKPQSYRDINRDYLDPVQGKSEEVGIKGEWYEGRLNASLSYYRTYQDNVATGAEDANGNPIYIPGSTDQAYYGAMGQTTRGIELEISGEIRPGWNLFFGASKMKAEGPDGVQINTFLPEKTVKLFTTYNLPGDNSQWTIGGGARWQSESWNTLGVAGVGPIRNSQSAFAVVDLMARYDINETWSAQLNVNNVFDKVYYPSASVAAVYGEPRNAMLTLTSRF
ncbi:TonB-dependent siderophore receptor [Xinfangfangia sp. D13-10-4-6]|uniref:TonB-dependent siderophore receptor n=1 Tax=Pseudogemmobacter hezensis TaxID=2737662 RepID=UPI001553DC08|nr:TonB-dependent receptor [Pseudogemmobacter hezensis]NPD16359.1 TonB-dependent siderophore receptor [Pseudogemmobacter hezensis]